MILIIYLHIYIYCTNYNSQIEIFSYKILITYNKQYSQMSLSFKKNSLVICNDEQAYGVHNRVGKVFAIVERKNPYDQFETMVLFKLNYNGQWYIIPAVYLRKASAEEKKQDKRNPSYWKDEKRQLNLGKITYERRTTNIFPY